jgi:hypothetical protein
LLLAALVLGFIIVVTSWRGAYRLRKRNTVCDRIGGS